MSSQPVLYRCPSCLSLPTADPHGLAVETLLRIENVRYAKRDAPSAQLRLTVPKDASISPAANKSDSSAATARDQTYAGFSSCMHYLGEQSDAGIIHNDEKPALACIEALTTHCLYPAFTFLIHFDTNLFNYAVRKSVVPKVGGWLEILCGTYRRHVLQSNVYYFDDARTAALPNSALSVSALNKMEAVLQEVERALRALELLHVAHASANETFILNTSRPCSADAYAYAGASCFLHADFGGPHGSAPLAAFQKRMREECPMLLKYVERLRQILFEDYSGSYHLKPLDVPEMAHASESAALEDMYRHGRLQTLVWTATFASLYFVMANADVLLALLSASAEGLEADEETELEQRGEHNVAHDAQAQPNEVARSA